MQQQKHDNTGDGNDSVSRKGAETGAGNAAVMQRKKGIGGNVRFAKTDPFVPGEQPALINTTAEQLPQVSQFKPGTGKFTPVTQKRNNSLFSSRAVIQGNFVALDGERIGHIIKKAEENGENIDGDFLEGLYETQTDHNANRDNPTLYLEVAKVPKYAITGNVYDTNKIRLFVDARTIENAEATALAEKDRINAREFLQVMTEDTRFYTLQEGGPYTYSKIRQNWTTATNDGEQGRAAADGLIGNILTGGVEQGGGGGYGSIEFRFKKATGVLHVTSQDDFAESETVKTLLNRNKQIKLNVMAPKYLELFKEVYMQYKYPHPEERTGKGFLFVEEEIIDAFMDTVKEVTKTGKADSMESDIDVEHQNDTDVLPPGPGASHKDRDKTYDTKARRGNRGQGQAAVMRGWSAGNYVKHFNSGADMMKWEWLHIQGARLGGPNVPTNLVAGTDAANTAMIPYERLIYDLSKVATALKPVKVDWRASLKKDDKGADTHIGDKISMAVSFPSGMPPAKDGLDPAELIKPFPVTFNAVEGQQVTKLERDITELRAGKDLG
jgi:hypothetical protein